jgi:hypothetical protein
MKRIIFTTFMVLAMVGMTFAQSRKTTAVTVDTVKGAVTKYFVMTPGASDGVLAFQVLATQLGGTTNEVGSLEFSIDGTSYVRYSGAYKDNEFVKLYASDTTKIAKNGATWTATNAGVFGGVITEPVYPYYRVKIVGESGDTTKYTVKYTYLKK